MDTTTKPKVTATDFFLHLGFIISFYTFVVTYATFLFSLINTFFPDRQYDYFDPYGSEMRFSVSMLIVATPLVIVLLKKIYKELRNDPEKNNIWIRRWSLYLTLFVSITALAIDLVILINTFLGGEISTRFMLKAVTILIIGGLVWWYTRQELHNSLATNPKKAKTLTWSIVVIILVSMIAGFSLIGSPTTLRHIRDDNQRENDLSNIRNQVINYYQSKHAVLPTTLEDMTLGNPYQTELPTDPETKQPYAYRVLPNKIVEKASFPAFELCATFAEDVSIDSKIQRTGGMTSPTYSDVSYPTTYDTDFSKHPAGNKCFEISIDPERYTQITK